MKALNLFALAAVIALITVSQNVLADDTTATTTFEQAKATFAQRELPAQVDKSIQLLDQAFADAQDTNLKYDILILKSRAYHWKGKKGSDENTRLNDFVTGYTTAEQAKKLNDDFAEAYFFYAVNLGDWGQLKGPLQALSKKKQLESNLDEASDRKTREGRDGTTIDGYGIDRIYGRMHYVLKGNPVMDPLGRFRGKALKQLGNAYKRNNEDAKAGEAYVYALNGVYYAEALFNGGNDKEKAEAKAVLADLVTKDAQSLNPNRIPETQDELETARKLLAQYSKN